MSISRIFQPGTYTPDQIINLELPASHHLIHVLRARVGDKVTLFNGHGCEFEATIVNLSKKVVGVKIAKKVTRSVESSLKIHLAQAITRGEKMDFIIQKAVELGVTQITPLITERVNVRLKAEQWQKKLCHWQGVVRGACEQSGRNLLPEIASPISFSAWVPPDADLRVVLDPHVSGDVSLLPMKPCSVTLLIGPEGGFTSQEVDKVIQAGFNGLNLGPRILRAETATIAAISIIQAHYGDMKLSPKNL